MVDVKLKDIIWIMLFSALILIMNVNPILINKSMYNLTSAIEKERVNYKTRDYLKTDTEHFVIKYTEQDINNFNIIKQTAEGSYNSLNNVFNNDFNKKITIIIFPSIYEMNSQLGLPKEQKSMGLYYSGFISMLSPNVWISENKDKENTFKKYGPILHELAHYFVDKQTNGNYPLWFTEGVAVYFEKEILGVEMKPSKNIKYSMDDLQEHFESLDQDSAYKNSYDIIYNYINKNSLQALLDVINHLGRGYSLEDLGICSVNIDIYTFF